MKMFSRVSQEKRRKRRLRSSARKNLKQGLKILPFILPPVATAFILTWLYTRSNIVALPIEGLRVERTNLIKRNDTLRLNIEQLQAPYRIDPIARKKLGMISPEVWQVVVLDKPVRAPEPAIQVAGDARPLNSPGLLRSLLQKANGPAAARVPSQATEQPG
jgi:cell division protein FtsB